MFQETDKTIYLLVGITVLLSVSAFLRPALLQELLHSPYDIKRRNQWYRLLTSGFVHADPAHLFFNMFVFYNFAPHVLEAYKLLFGIKAVWFFLVLYLGGIVISDLPSYVKQQDNPNYRSLGASGGVSAILFTFIFIFPEIKLQLLFLPIPLSGLIWGLIYLAVTYVLSKRGGGRINHSAHLTGALFGVLYTILLKPALIQDFLSSLKHIF